MFLMAIYTFLRVGEIMATPNTTMSHYLQLQSVNFTFNDKVPIAYTVIVGRGGTLVGC